MARQRRLEQTSSTPELFSSSDTEDGNTPESKKMKHRDTIRHKMTVESLSGQFVLVRCPPGCTHTHTHTDILTDPLGQKLHFICTKEGCAFESHSRYKNVYHKHRRECSKSLENSRLAQVESANNQGVIVQRFVGKVLPCLQTLTNLSSSRFVCLVHKYEDLRHVPGTMIKRALPESNLKKWHHYCEVLSHDIWGKLSADVDSRKLYGIAVDADIDKVKAEHILLSVLYVGSEEYVLPPIYSPRHRAFDGKTAAEQLISTLLANLGEVRLLKMRYIIADGSDVNHVVIFFQTKVFLRMVAMLKYLMSKKMNLLCSKD